MKLSINGMLYYPVLSFIRDSIMPSSRPMEPGKRLTGALLMCALRALIVWENGVDMHMYADAFLLIVTFDILSGLDVLFSALLSSVFSQNFSSNFTHHSFVPRPRVSINTTQLCCSPSTIVWVFVLFR